MVTSLNYRPIHARRARWLLALYLVMLLVGLVGLFMSNENGTDPLPVPVLAPSPPTVVSVVK